MLLTLTREATGPTGTIGMIDVAGRRFPTLERPTAAEDKHDSCLPAGTYRLQPVLRAGGERAFAVINAALRVWQLPSEVPSSARTDARSAVFLAAGFSLDDLVGCHIAPGKSRSKGARGWTLDDTRHAMNEIRTLVGARLELQLLIHQGFA